MHRIRLRQPWTADWVNESADRTLVRYLRRFNASPGMLRESRIDLSVRLASGLVSRINLNGHPLNLDENGRAGIREWLQPANLLTIDVQHLETLVPLDGEVELQIHE